jgi:RND superfamily putative drug exporter
VFLRLGRWCHDHRWIVVVAWVAALVLGNVAARGVGTAYSSSVELPSVESRQGMDVLDQAFGGAGGDTATVVFTSPAGVRDPAVEQAMTAYFDRITAETGLTVVSPYGPTGAGQTSATADVAFARIELPGELGHGQASDLADRIRDLQPEVDGLRVAYGGDLFASFEPPSSEVLGLAFAIVILILAFGSVLAMGLPVGVALAGIGLGSVVIALLTHVVGVPDVATTLGVMIGLGVGIDYALFIVTRFREQLRAGHTVRESVGIALDTSGRAVAFAGLTVVVSLLGMLLMGIDMTRGLGIGAAAVVLVTMGASLTLLPALLAFAGHRVEVTRWRGLVAAGLVAVALVGVGLAVQPLLVGLPLALVVLVASFVFAPLRRAVPRPAHRPLRQTLAYRWSRFVQRHPWWCTVLGASVLVLLAVPLLGMRLGFPDQGNDPTDRTTRQAYDLIAQGFGPGYNGPLIAVTELPAGTGAAELDAVTQALAATPGVQIASPPVLDGGGDLATASAALWRIVPTTSPQDAETTDLVHRLRDEVLPAATQGSGLDVKVTGQVAVQIDFSDYLAARLPLFFGVVLGLSFLLLMAVFRSLLVPLKAVVMNLLSIGAAYGVLVALFQWGWFGAVLGLEGAPIQPFVPMLLFAVVFGLSMDYEVFLLSRVKEEYDRTGDAHTSVADGLAATARVITAAAAIMVFVFGSFLLDAERMVKLMGVGLAVAVLLDATIVRMLLVPATMELLGARNWWLPRWIDRILPTVDVEGHLDDSLDAELEALAQDDPRREPETADAG